MLSQLKLGAPKPAQMLWLALAALCAQVAGAAESELTLLSGETRKAQIDSISADGTIHLANEKVAFEELRRIDRAVPSAGEPEKAIHLLLGGGGELFANSIQVVDEVCVVSGHELGAKPLRIPIDLVVGISFEPDDLPDSIANAFGEERDEDQIILRIDDSIETLSGLVEQLDANEITFVWNEETRTVPRKNLIAIAVASSGEMPPSNCLIRFSSGSAIAAKIRTLENGELTVAISDDAMFSVDWNMVASISIRSDRLQFLADIEPSVFEHNPIVTTQRTWRRNLNVSGNELRLGNRVYANGIGVASNSRLEYELADEFSRFCATLGIDAQTEGRGECVFLVRGDGQELARQTIGGSSEPYKLDLDIRGVRKLELIVEPGADLDLADHANWCDACLIRP